MVDTLGSCDAPSGACLRLSLASNERSDHDQRLDDVLLEAEVDGFLLPGKTAFRKDINDGGRCFFGGVVAAVLVASGGKRDGNVAYDTRGFVAGVRGFDGFSKVE